MVCACGYVYFKLYFPLDFSLSFMCFVHVISLCSGALAAEYVQLRWSTITVEICGPIFLYYSLL
jgi:hypothetical protein